MKHRFVTAAILALIVSAPAIAAESGELTELDASKTGIEQIDENRIPPSIRDALADLRKATVAQRDAATAAARKLMRDLEAATERAGDKLKAAGDKAQREWAETKMRIQALIAETETRIEKMQSATAEQWVEARNAVADALQDAADALRSEG